MGNVPGNRRCVQFNQSRGGIFPKSWSSFATKKHLTTKMADDAVEAPSPAPDIKKCVIHFPTVNNVVLKEFSAITWSKALAAAEILKYTEGEKCKIATGFLVDVATTTATSASDSVNDNVNVLTTTPAVHARFHRNCYQKFTDQRKLVQAQRKRHKTEFEGEFLSLCLQ